MESGAVGHNLKGTHPRTIPAMFGLIQFRGFRGEELNVKVYDGRTPSDGKSSHGHWPGELIRRRAMIEYSGLGLWFLTTLSTIFQL